LQDKVSIICAAGAVKPILTQRHGEEEEKNIRSRPQDVGDTRAHQERSTRVIAPMAQILFRVEQAERCDLSGGGSGGF